MIRNETVTEPTGDHDAFKPRERFKALMEGTEIVVNEDGEWFYIDQGSQQFPLPKESAEVVQIIEDWPE